MAGAVAATQCWGQGRSSAVRRHASKPSFLNFSHAMSRQTAPSGVPCTAPSIVMLDAAGHWSLLYGWPDAITVVAMFRHAIFLMQRSKDVLVSLILIARSGEGAEVSSGGFVGAFMYIQAQGFSFQAMHTQQAQGLYHDACNRSMGVPMVQLRSAQANAACNGCLFVQRHLLCKWTITAYYCLKRV